ncbi:protein LIKE COV 3-like isoform X3 [Tripterygium wilfordii]|uniref:protein LIKE COV 3-like isoform X3 n=1 Tax=Tripterygium wilfordii TaxID=458696 RepID=UPI0018F85CA5|nr:protein LIKE COV 3-like isoform X3 [Tripterygium wilfordii]
MGTTREMERDLECLIPIAGLEISANEARNVSSGSVLPQASSSHHSSGKEAFSKVIRSWASKKFMTGCVILLPIAITFYITWWFIHFVDGIFSPIYTHLGVNTFVPSPDQSSGAFKEVAIIRHPRIGEYAIGFITSTVVLRGSSGAEELSCVYVPTNHMYLGDMFLISSKDIMRPNLSVREGIEIVISGGMSIPQIITTLDAQAIPTRSSKFAVPKV